MRVTVYFGSTELIFAMKKIKGNRAVFCQFRAPSPNPFETGAIGPDLFRAACRMGLQALVRSVAIGPTGPAGQKTG